MKRGFWHGMVTGGLVGAVLGMVMAPEWRPAARRMTVEAGNMGSTMEGRARRMWRRARSRFSEGIVHRMGE